jgi:hypothetical protein
MTARAQESAKRSKSPPALTEGAQGNRWAGEGARCLVRRAELTPAIVMTGTPVLACHN